MINVLVINGSPRPSGNTNHAINSFLKFLPDEHSFSINRLNLCDLTINHCRGCNICAENGGECVIVDDMVSIYESIENSDVVIMATPIYFSGPSSYMKQMIDRCQCIWMREVESPSKRLGIMIAVSGQKDANFKNTRSIIKSFLNTIGAEWGGELIYPGYDDCGELAADEGTILMTQEGAKNIYSKITEGHTPRPSGGEGV